jgi:hypothetical protein
MAFRSDVVAIVYPVFAATLFVARLNYWLVRG